MNKLISFLTVLLLLVTSSLFAQTVQVGDTAPDFLGITYYGEEFSVTDATKDSIVVMFFMGYS